MWRRKTREPKEKPLELGENQQQTQPTRHGEYRNRTQVTEVGGERISAVPPMLPKNATEVISPLMMVIVGPECHLFQFVLFFLVFISMILKLQLKETFCLLLHV